MNVLLVDDQQSIVDSLKKGIRWERIPADNVYTACSAKEAKLLIMNFEVDVLVTDIEMPEENGLSLVQWTKEKFPDIECVFLTSHADFSYAKEAIRMGGFDYILQPARFEEVENVLKKVLENTKRKKRLHKLQHSKNYVIKQRNTILDAIISHISMGKSEEADYEYDHFSDLFQFDYESCAVYPALVQILRWKRINYAWDEKLVRLVLGNVIEELFESLNGKAAISGMDQDMFWLVLAAERGRMDFGLWKQRMEEFYQFMEENMEFSLAVYPIGEGAEQKFSAIYKNLSGRLQGNGGKKSGLFWDNDGQEPGEPEEDTVKCAIDYIKKNLHKNITRAEVADRVHLHEDYFSKVFRQQTGDTFKDYVQMEKMKLAQELLVKSRLSISIIASKVGYDNFSHFSKMFKKITNKTPYEYRKENAKQ
ncbi:MAG TPA: response regulator [Clostridiales bacterium]|nr:response regulator [Clostridiales bacterium]